MTYGAWSISGIEKSFFSPYAPLISGTAYLPACINDSAYEVIKKYFKQYGNKTAALVIEPTIGFGGVYKISIDYMDKLRKLCIDNNVLLIFDEVSTGFYRTGSKFAYERYNLTPDILCLSKGINNGILPLGAVLFKGNVLDNMEDNEVFAHISTQNYNPILSASGLATLELYQEKEYEKIVTELSRTFNSLLLNNLNVYISGFRIDGLFIAIELDEKYDDLTEIIFKLKDNGLLTYPFENPYSRGIFLLPMYITDKRSAEEIIEIIQNTLKSFGRNKDE